MEYLHRILLACCWLVTHGAHLLVMDAPCPACNTDLPILILTALAVRSMKASIVAQW